MVKHRNGWRDEVTPAYEEGGKAIGRAIMLDSSKEPYYWSLVKDLKIWPRWYLKAFATLYKQSHLDEYENLKSRKRWRRDKMRKQEERLRSSLPGPIKMSDTKPKNPNPD
jgi:hypothetical protein